jgi:hypothetical protein
MEPYQKSITYHFQTLGEKQWAIVDISSNRMKIEDVGSPEHRHTYGIFQLVDGFWQIDLDDNTIESEFGHAVVLDIEAYLNEHGAPESSIAG